MLYHSAAWVLTFILGNVPNIRIIPVSEDAKQQKEFLVDPNPPLTSNEEYLSMSSNKATRLSIRSPCLCTCLGLNEKPFSMTMGTFRILKDTGSEFPTFYEITLLTCYFSQMRLRQGQHSFCNFYLGPSGARKVQVICGLLAMCIVNSGIVFTALSYQREDVPWPIIVFLKNLVRKDSPKISHSQKDSHKTIFLAK